MKDLILHIENLLPEHDCVVVPGLGGFMQNETESEVVHDKETFYPRGKEVSFNSRLTFNDGILVQSYQEYFKISFEDAVERIREEVREVHKMLDEGKFVRFGRIGTIFKADEGNLQFRPDNKNLFFPESYGLMPFVYPNLESRTRKSVMVRQKKHHEDPFIHIRLSKRSLQNILTGIAASFLVLFISKPAGSIEKINNQKAFLLQEYIMDEPIKNQIDTEPIFEKAVVAEPTEIKTVVSERVFKNDIVKVQPVKEPVISTSITNSRNYYIIISSFPTNEGAKKWLDRNKSGIYSHAGIIVRDGRARIYINQFRDKKSAESWVEKFRDDNPNHDDAWLLSVKN
jgi:hypothetical protein